MAQAPTSWRGAVARRRAAPPRTRTGDQAYRLDAEQVAIGLGWFSIGLGLVEILSPGRLTRAFDTERQEPVYRLYGARELAAGAGLLLVRDKSPFLWARVAGDVMDLATLALGLGGRRQSNVMAGLAAVAGVTALDIWAAKSSAAQEWSAITAAGPRKGGGRAWRHGALEVERAITIGRPADELLDLLTEEETLPRIMAPVAEVVQLGGGRARWAVTGPAGLALEWETQIVSNDGEHRLRFEAEGSPALVRRGTISFEKAPKDFGTVMRARLAFEPPGGALGRGAAALFGDQLPGALVDKTLHYFKALAETGEVPTTDGQPAARRDMR